MILVIGSCILSLRKMTNIGKAYGFFDCRASIDEIQAEIPKVRSLVKVPSRLELSLQEQSGIGNKYLLTGSFPANDNGHSASELMAVFNQLYQTPLYRHREPFRGGIEY